MRASCLFLSLAALAALAVPASAYTGGGAGYLAEFEDFEISPKNPQVSWSTNGAGQPYAWGDYKGFRFEASAPVFGASRAEPQYPSSSHFLAGVSWQGDSGLVRVSYRQARRFYTEGAFSPATNASMRMGIFDLEGIWWGSLPSLFLGRPVATEGGLRDGLPWTGFRMLPYMKLGYSRMGMTTDRSLSEDAGLTNEFDEVREMRVNAFTSSWGIALQSNLWGFYLDPEFCFGGGLILGSTRRDRAFPETYPGWKHEEAPQWGIAIPYSLGIETGYKRGPFRFGLDFEMEMQPTAYDDLAYTLAYVRAGISAGLRF